MLVFFKIVPLAFHTIIPVSFILVEVPLKHFFWYDLKLQCHISFDVLKSYQEYLEEFSVLLDMGYNCTILGFIKNV